MRRLLPPPAAEVDPYEAYRPADPAAPLLRLNMITSADGAATDARGRTRALGGPGDLALFRALRALADCILVGASTVRTEGYTAHRVRPEHAARRAADGRPQPAATAIVSRRLDLDFGHPLFTEAASPTIVVTVASADPQRLTRARAVAHTVVAGEHDVDFAVALGQLRALTGPHILCEGGPTLNATLFAGELIDELCLTIAPQLAGSGRLPLVAAPGPVCELELAAVHEQDGELYLRYRVRGSR